MLRSLISLSAGLLAAGCAGPALTQLRTRAAFDFQCPEAQLQLTALNGGTSNGVGAIYGVTGCGQRATYVQQVGEAWVLDTSTGRPQPQ